MSTLSLAVVIADIRTESRPYLSLIAAGPLPRQVEPMSPPSSRQNPPAVMVEVGGIEPPSLTSILNCLYDHSRVTPTHSKWGLCDESQARRQPAGTDALTHASLRRPARLP